MPEISRFYGISIYLYPREHPPAHFHAFYGDDEAVFGIDALEILEGSLPNRARSFVVEWLNCIEMNFSPRGIACAPDKLPRKLLRSNKTILI
ncbi:MAG: DUF4160 domain-containing protein [Limisphaerales bacterium]